MAPHKKQNDGAGRINARLDDDTMAQIREWADARGLTLVWVLNNVIKLGWPAFKTNIGGDFPVSQR